MTVVRLEVSSLLAVKVTVAVPEKKSYAPHE